MCLLLAAETSPPHVPRPLSTPAPPHPDRTTGRRTNEPTRATVHSNTATYRDSACGPRPRPILACVATEALVIAPAWAASELPSALCSLICCSMVDGDPEPHTAAAAFLQGCGETATGVLARAAHSCRVANNSASPCGAGGRPLRSSSIGSSDPPGSAVCPSHARPSSNMERSNRRTPGVEARRDTGFRLARVPIACGVGAPLIAATPPRSCSSCAFAAVCKYRRICGTVNV